MLVRILRFVYMSARREWTKWSDSHIAGSSHTSHFQAIGTSNDYTDLAPTAIRAKNQRHGIVHPVDMSIQYRYSQTIYNAVQNA